MGIPNTKISGARQAKNYGLSRVGDFSMLEGMGNGDLSRAVRRDEVSLDATGYRLRLIREAMGWSQSKMADAMGVKLNNYQSMEYGNTWPNPRYVETLLQDHGFDHLFIYRGDWSRLPAEKYQQIRDHLGL